MPRPTRARPAADDGRSQPSRPNARSIVWLPSQARVTPAAAGRTVSPCSGGAAQLARVAAGGRVVAVGAEHAHELGDDLRLLELFDRGARRVGAGVLDDREVAVPERGDLGQMGYAQNLPAFG